MYSLLQNSEPMCGQAPFSHRFNWIVAQNGGRALVQRYGVKYSSSLSASDQCWALDTYRQAPEPAAVKSHRVLSSSGAIYKAERLCPGYAGDMVTTDVDFLRTGKGEETRRWKS
jgi:hypothetical protein